MLVVWYIDAASEKSVVPSLSNPVNLIALVWFVVVGSPSNIISPNTLSSPCTASVTSITVLLARYQVNVELPPET